MQPRTIIWLAAVVLALVLLGGWCIPTPSPSADLAAATREAVGLARDAVARNASAGMFRLLAIVAGVSVPLVIAYLIWRFSAQGELDATEIIDAVQQYDLPPPAGPDAPALPDTASLSQPVQTPDEP